MPPYLDKDGDTWEDLTESEDRGLFLGFLVLIIIGTVSLLYCMYWGD